MFATLLLVGLACVIAALVGGGVKLFNIETPEIRSLWRQVSLAAVGLVLIGADVAFFRTNSSSTTAPPAETFTPPTTTPLAQPAPPKTVKTQATHAQAPPKTVAVDRRIPASGTYRGEASQRGSASRVNKNYPVSMTFSSSGSTITYSTLGCFGDLRPLGFQGTRRVYQEQITSGHCDQGGTWRVRVDGPRDLEAAWSSNAVDYTVIAVLTR